LQLNCKAIGFKYYLTKTSPSCEWEDNRRPLGATISTCFLLTFLLQVLIKTKNGWHAARVNGVTVYGPPTHPPSNNISSKKYMIYSVFSSKDFYSLYSWEQRQKRLWDINFSLTFFFLIFDQELKIMRKGIKLKYLPPVDFTAHFNIQIQFTNIRPLSSLLKTIYFFSLITKI